ncbi:UNVERIFIED_CONTAM: hypothetical protein FKN15_065704 [Acipenser sinensis]
MLSTAPLCFPGDRTRASCESSADENETAAARGATGAGKDRLSLSLKDRKDRLSLSLKDRKEPPLTDETGAIGRVLSKYERNSSMRRKQQSKITGRHDASRTEPAS